MASIHNRVTEHVLQCNPQCSLIESKIGHDNALIILTMRNEGGGAPSMARRASELLGRRVPVNSMARHIKHMKEVADEAFNDLPDEKINDIEMLDDIIKAAHRNRKAWRPTIKDALEAMKLKTAMTGQSAFEDMLTAMSAAELTPEENPEAESAPDEQVPETAGG